jgi:hypothetical protein
MVFMKNLLRAHNSLETFDKKAQNLEHIYRKTECILAFNKATLEQWPVLASAVDRLRLPALRVGRPRD